MTKNKAIAVFKNAALGGGNFFTMKEFKDAILFALNVLEQPSLPYNLDEVVEAYVNTYERIPGGSYVEFLTNVPASQFKRKDKVRIIILKEED